MPSGRPIHKSAAGEKRRQRADGSADGAAPDDASPERPAPAILPLVAPPDLGYARLVLELIEGRDVAEAERERLPTSPADWFGLATVVRTAPAGKGRAAVDRFLANQAPRHPEIAGEMRRALALAAEHPEPPPEAPKPRRLKLFGASELAHTDFAPEWLIEEILVARQPCLIGAPKKGMKTSMAIDLGVSIAAGLPFLGQFPVPKPIATIIVSGESGGSAIQSTTQRVCHSKGIRVDDLEGRFFVGFELPRLADDEDMAELAALIREVGAGVVVVDPLYLCLASGASNGRPVDMKNLFDVGPLLLAVAKTCLDAGATPILIHHNKLTGGSDDGKPELGNLAFAGIQEFARQWILLGRRGRFVPGSGVHELWLTVGGSIGHSGEWAVDVREGTMDRDFSGRTWEVTVKTAGDAINEEKAARATRAKTRQAEAEIAKTTAHRDHEARVLDALGRLGGQASRSKAYGAAGLNGSNGPAALARLEADGRIEPCQLTYPKGSGRASGPGVRLVEPRHTPTYPD